MEDILTEEEKEKVDQIDAIGNQLDFLAHSYFLVYTMGPNQDIGWCLNGEHYHLVGILDEAMRQHLKMADCVRPECCKPTDPDENA